MGKSKRVKKGKKEDKVTRVMREFKQGTLKDRSGNIVTDRKQAIAIALSEAGLSKKSLMKAEILNKIRVAKSEIKQYIRKEEERHTNIKEEVINFFKNEKEITDEKVHEFAENLGISPDELENFVYKLLSNLIGGGKSKGEENSIPEEKIQEGIKVELEHTEDESIARKIALDHLHEDIDYYTKLKQVEVAG